MKIHQLMHQGVTDLWAASVYWKKSSKAPDYKPVAAASIEAAKIADQLGRDQMAQAQALHDEQMALAKPWIDEQMAASQETRAQAKDYYDYMVSQQRPVEEALNREAMNYDNSQDVRDRALITGGDTGIYEARKADIEDSVGRALADTRTGQAATTNQMIRQALRYGWSPEQLASRAGAQGLSMASQQAAAANGTRQMAIQQHRGLLAEDRNMRLSDSAREWARKLDVAGLYRNLPGASASAYGLSSSLGGGALGVNQSAGAQLLSANQGAASTIMGGQNTKVQGLTNVMNANNQAQSSSGQATGAAIGAVGSIAAVAI